MCGIDSGFTASGIGIAVRIIIDVSDWLNSRSRYWSTEKHARGVGLAARALRERVHQAVDAAEAGAAAAEVVVEVVGLHVEHELVARERARRPRRARWRRPSGTL